MKQVDVDVHVAPQTLEPLLEHMDDYWADYVANGELHLSPSMNGMYPPVAFEPSGDEDGNADTGSGESRAVACRTRR